MYILILQNIYLKLQIFCILQVWQASLKTSFWTVYNVRDKYGKYNKVMIKGTKTLG